MIFSIISKYFVSFSLKSDSHVFLIAWHPSSKKTILEIAFTICQGKIQKLLERESVDLDYCRVMSTDQVQKQKVCTPMPPPQFAIVCRLPKCTQCLHSVVYLSYLPYCIWYSRAYLYYESDIGSCIGINILLTLTYILI